jgi:hypothetical protein
MITRDMINKMDAEKRRVKKEIYKRIHEQFCRKIQSVASAGHRQVLLTVPPFVLGYPTYDVTKAALYLKRQLQNGGFDVNFAHPASLFVTWFPESKKHEDVLPVYEHLAPIPEEDTTLPSLINLKKAANKYRSSSDAKNR